MDVESPQPRLAWSHWYQACWHILCGRTRRPALVVALIVGTALTLINQGDALVHGDLGVAVVLRMLANFAIPYVVSSIGVLSNHRVGRG